MSYQAEYIWIDGTEPTPLLRSKTRIVEGGKEPGIWGFDGPVRTRPKGTTPTASSNRSSRAPTPCGRRATSSSCAKSCTPI